MKEDEDKYTIVAFRYDAKRSVLYRDSPNVPEIARLVAHALSALQADVISIRRVYQKRPIPNQKTL